MVNFRSLDAGEHVRFVIRKRPDDNAVTAVIRAESTGKLSEVLLVLLERINHML
uniref:Bm9914 n=1 Tax=Brugia malayi TaxID=6279 RepID=A0A0J9XUW1_BRUMA|nr:Bm9914 [Brugia malayi]